MDFFGMMKKAEELKSKMAEMQAKLGELRAEGRAGGGMVRVTLSGKGELVGVSIDPTLFKEDSAEILEDLLVAAHADAKGRVESEVSAKMADMTAGLPLPPGMKLPF